MYEVEYLDGECASLSANHIAENLFAQVDNEGNQQVLMKKIIDNCTSGQEVKQQDTFITLRTGTKRRRETTKGWEILIEWKDGSMNWVALKDVKESYPVQVAKFAISNHIAEEPAFAWWVPFVMKDQLPVGYQFMKCHMIFDIKFGENFHHKAQLVAGGHMTETPATLMYSSVVSRDSVRIALTVAALNDLQVMSCDIQNAYLTADC